MSVCKAMAVLPTPKLANKPAKKLANHSAGGSQLLPPSFQPSLPMAVAFSGGADSTALLLDCVRQWPGQVRAIHIHHGLQNAADQFANHCQQLCEQLQVPLVQCKVNAKNEAGQSPEDAARRARYAALSEAVHAHPALQGVKDVAVAQHADDQVETLLLALSRGAGLAGLASMPAKWTRDGLQWHRPLLNVPGAKLREYLLDAQVTWVEDPTNQDEQFTRNRIRAQLLPALERAFPQFRDTFARSASHAAEAQDILNEVAAVDLGSVQENGLPNIKAVQQLSLARQSLVLRHWLKVQHQTTPSAVQMTELLSQIAACTTRGHQMHLKVGRGYVRREGPVLVWSAEN
jgi:tRNA(Ile)-lysidine synthase